MLSSRRPGVRFAVIALYLGLAVLAPGGTTAASCTGNSHVMALAQGTASPGSGTTSTTFTFEVTYTDSGGCAPDRIVVWVEGVGELAMRHDRGSLTDGAVYRTRTRLAVGRHDYWFEATSGSGPGLRTDKLTGVQPGAVVVSAPTPPPDKATSPPDKATPPPDPTPRPTRAPRPDPTPTARPSQEPSRSEPPGPEPTDAPPTDTTPPGSGTSSHPGAGIGTIRRPHDGRPPVGAPRVFSEAPSPMLSLLVASLGSLGGLILFALLGTRFADPVRGRPLPGMGGRSLADPRGKER